MKLLSCIPNPAMEFKGNTEHSTKGIPRQGSESKELLVRCIQGEYLKSTLSAVKKIGVKITSSCNLKCPHCLDSVSTPCSPNIEEILHTIQKSNIKSQKVLEVDITGGEPFLYSKELLHFYRKMLSFYYGKYKLNFFINTNGTLLDDDIIFLASQPNVHICLSLDGNQKIHDLSRQSSGPYGTFSRIYRNLSYLSKIGVSISVVALTVTQTTLDIDKEELLGILKKFKIPSITIQIEKELDSHFLQKYQLVVELILFFRKNGIIVNSEFLTVTKRILKGTPNCISFLETKCAAYNPFILNIGPNGERMTCVYANKSSSFEQNIKRLLHSRCLDCPHILWCSGPCVTTKEDAECKIIRRIMDLNQSFPGLHNR